jgi:RHS repeat-associated protein
MGSTSGSGQSFVYDPFGNLLQENPFTKGSAPSMNISVSPNNNRIYMTGFGYDAAGNLAVRPNGQSSDYFSYDSENRLTQAGFGGASAPFYYYGAKGERLFDGQNWHYYGPDGRDFGTLAPSLGGNFTSFSSYSPKSYFAGRLVYQTGYGPLNTDRLGSVVYSQNGPREIYFPYGVNTGTQGAAGTAFATYYRDTTNSPSLDYAMNRYYDFARGRFTSPDPRASGSVSNPMSWNRYSYTRGDPVNHYDPSGLDPQCGPGQTWMGEGCYGTTDPLYDASYPTDPSQGCVDDPGYDFVSIGTSNCGPASPVATPPPAAPPLVPNCGSSVSSLIPSTTEGRDEIAVELGENSWYMYRWGLGGVTANDVGVEDAYMVATMKNLARAYNHSVEWTIQNNQYNGYAAGWQLLNDALDETQNSSDCQDLLWAISGYTVGQTLNIPYTQWRKVGGTHPGGVVIAGTVFFTPAVPPRRRP